MGIAFLFLGRCGSGRVEDGGWDQFRDPQPGMIFSDMHIYRELDGRPDAHSDCLKLVLNHG